MTVDSIRPVEAERREGVGPNGEPLTLYIDPIALRALDAARAQQTWHGGSPGTWGQLPEPEELPLKFVLLEMRVERLEAHIGYGPRGGENRHRHRDGAGA